MKYEINLALQRGWKIFPLVNRSRFAVEQPYLDQATSSVAQVEEWITQYPDCRWAVATGAESGVFAVEFTRDRGIPMMRSHCAGDFTAMDTLQVRMANRITMFFRWPDVGLPISRRQRIAEGILLRHLGGFADLPTETERSSFGYKYSNLDAPIADAPGWLSNLIEQAFLKHRVADVIPFSVRKSNTRLVSLSFTLKEKLWICRFYSIQEGVMVKTLTFRSSNSILTLAGRGGFAMTPGNVEWLQSNVRKGSGSLLLTLTTRQYERLLVA